MASFVRILIFIFCHCYIGLNALEKFNHERNLIGELETEKMENIVKDGELRKVRREVTDNEIGGLNGNDPLTKTVTVSPNTLEYSAAGTADKTKEVSMVQMTTVSKLNTVTTDHAAVNESDIKDENEIEINSIQPSVNNTGIVSSNTSEPTEKETGAGNNIFSSLDVSTSTIKVPTTISTSPKVSDGLPNSAQVSSVFSISVTETAHTMFSSSVSSENSAFISPTPVMVINATSEGITSSTSTTQSSQIESAKSSKQSVISVPSSSNESILQSSALKFTTSNNFDKTVTPSVLLSSDGFPNLVSSKLDLIASTPVIDKHPSSIYTESTTASYSSLSSTMKVSVMSISVTKVISSITSPTSLFPLPVPTSSAITSSTSPLPTISETQYSTTPTEPITNTETVQNNSSINIPTSETILPMPSVTSADSKLPKSVSSTHPEIITTPEPQHTTAATSAVLAASTATITTTAATYTTVAASTTTTTTTTTNSAISTNITTTNNHTQESETGNFTPEPNPSNHTFQPETTEPNHTSSTYSPTQNTHGNKTIPEDEINTTTKELVTVTSQVTVTNKPTPEPKTSIPTTKVTTSKITTEAKTNIATPEPTTSIPTTKSITTKITTEAKTNIPTPEPKTSIPTTKSTTTQIITEAKTSIPTPEPNTRVFTTTATTTKITTKPSIPTPEPKTSIPTPEPKTNTPTSEPDTSYTQEPEPEPTGEPEEPQSEFDVFAEPGPDWELAKPIWKEAWEFHVYFFGVAFALLGLYCFISVIRLWKMDHLLSRHYFVTLNILVVIICILRASYLLIDAYNSLGTFPIIVDYFMYSTVFPCLTAIFSILFYALLLATRVRVLSRKIQKLWVLIVIITMHFLLSFITDIVVGLYSTAGVLLFICQSVFILWGLIMFVGYLIIFRRLYSGAKNRQQALYRNNHDRKNAIAHGFHEKLPKQRYTIGLAVKITLISAFFGVACVGFELYGMFGVYGAFRNTKPEPWPWWTYHVIVRMLELLMGVSVAYVATQPLKYTYSKNKQHKLKFLSPCELFCCHDKLHSQEDSSSFSMDHYVVSETDQLGWLKKLKHKKVMTANAPYPPHTAEKYTDPDATLLVRKVKQQKPSMLVVEDGFVRIRGDDEIVPQQYDMDTNSQSSHSSEVNRVNMNYVNSGVNVNDADQFGSPGSVNDDINSGGFRDIIANVFHPQEESRLSGYHGNSADYLNELDTTDDTDVDIAITESEHSDERASPVRTTSSTSDNSANIFRPLSMIDLAASMESELERAFQSSFVENSDLISHNSLPVSLERLSSDSSEYVYNERLYEKYGVEDHVPPECGESLGYSSDSGDNASKFSETRLLKSPVRRCKSEDTKSVPKIKRFEKNKYFSLSDMEHAGKQDESSTSDVSTKVLVLDD